MVKERISPRPKSPEKTRKGGLVFIGHGRSLVWRDLKEFLVDRLGVQYEEFNRESVAGISTMDRLKVMLDNASFAFLVMTAEDEHLDGTRHARENVVHEAGLFQGRLGFERAIIVMEEGCAEFSNIAGLTHLRFPRGNMLAVSEEIRRVLEREGILPGSNSGVRKKRPSSALSAPASEPVSKTPSKGAGNVTMNTGNVSHSNVNMHVGNKGGAN